MTYTEALRQAFFGLITSWKRIPRHWPDCWSSIKEASANVSAVVLLLCGPILAVTLAPLVALLIQADERKRIRDTAKARQDLERHYGHLTQRLDD